MDGRGLTGYHLFHGAHYGIGGARAWGVVNVVKSCGSCQVNYDAAYEFHDITDFGPGWDGVGDIAIFIAAYPVMCYKLGTCLPASFQDHLRSYGRSQLVIPDHFCGGEKYHGWPFNWVSDRRK